MLYEYLYALPEDDSFWDVELGGYNKHVCFRNYSEVPTNREDLKKWFNEQLPHWGKNARKLLTRWKIDNKDCVQDFQKEFDGVLTYCSQSKKEK